MSQPPIPESNPFPVGSRVELQLTEGKPLSLQIIKLFLSFTKSLVYLARPETSSNGLPPEIILKVFDPRYDDECFPHGMYPPLWTLEAETAAAQHRHEIRENAQMISQGTLSIETEKTNHISGKNIFINTIWSHQ